MNTLLIVVMAAVFFVLLLGLFNMMRGGPGNTSQKLMRWRVGLQFLAIIIVIVIVWLRGR